MDAAQVKPVSGAGDGATAESAAIFSGADSARSEEAKRIVERYAQAYVELGSWAAAYRRCYDTTNMAPRTVWNEAQAMSNYPGVRSAPARYSSRTRSRTPG